MTGQIEAYRNEIFQFLKTVSIKFEPFAYLMGQSYMNQYGIDNPHGEWNPYYRNLCGEYSEEDTRMTVYSPEAERQVPFDKDLAKHYPKTAAMYRIPNDAYTNLEEQYPENIGLIRSIAYPAPDIQAAIAAPNFTLLAYDSSLLHLNERESLLSCLKNFLDMVRVRWWVPEFGYEDMYAVTFWSRMWQHLPDLLLTQRFLNIRTPFVHPFHIWEYLKHKGLGDYRDVLTNNQSLWLYRNINFVLKNKGKNSNLIILAENLLQEVFVSLLYKDMYQDTGQKEEDCITTPEFRSFNIVTKEEVKTESFSTLNQRLLLNNLEFRGTPEYIEKTEEELGTHNFNILPTKYLEFKKETINTSNEKLMVNFFLDTLIYRYSQNDLSFNCEITEPLTNTKLSLYCGDMIALWYWSLMRSVGETPDKLPTRYRSHLAFKTPKRQLDDIKSSIFYHSTEFPIKELIDVETMLSTITWHDKQFLKKEEFAAYVVGQFRALLIFVSNIEQSNKLLYHNAMQSFFEDTMFNGWLTVSLSNKELYSDWINENEFVKSFIDMYEDLADPLEAYKKLSEVCFDALFPIDPEQYKEFIGNVRNIERIYTAIRDLFIQLGGYNVTYLETQRDTAQYIRIPEYDFYNVTQRIDMEGFWNTVIDNLQFKAAMRQEVRLDDVAIDFVFTKLSSVLRDRNTLILGIDWDRKQTWCDHRPIKIDPDIVSKKTINRTNRRITTDNTSCQKKV